MSGDDHDFRVRPGRMRDAGHEVMLATGRDWVIGPGASIFSYWWVYIPITLAIILFGISWNLLGDQINEYLNPTRTRPFREPTSP